MRRALLVLMSIVACTMATPQSLLGAAQKCGNCGCASKCSCECECGSSDCAGTVKKIVHAPTYEMQTRTVTRTGYKNEQRTRTYTVNKRVPYVEEKTCNYTVMVPEMHLWERT